ncbi:LPS translocon maturation chaperone LptM [Chitinilyticum litopenaei]|uniref:LPS translocon maturation chaperone LptM n=1 Tax=Chitinilyticum litopenaei TaxID=1121276 RepID=UPI0003F950C2|nr:lipoprotein [Chitinilyticum litopenaei]
MHKLIAMILGASLLAACGYKGALYLPGSEEAQKSGKTPRPATAQASEAAR